MVKIKDMTIEQRRKYNREANQRWRDKNREKVNEMARIRMASKRAQDKIKLKQYELLLQKVQCA